MKTDFVVIQNKKCLNLRIDFIIFQKQTEYFVHLLQIQNNTNEGITKCAHIIN